MHWVGMNLDFSGLIVNPRDLRISIVFRTLEKQPSYPRNHRIANMSHQRRLQIANLFL